MPIKMPASYRSPFRSPDDAPLRRGRPPKLRVEQRDTCKISLTRRERYIIDCAADDYSNEVGRRVYFGEYVARLVRASDPEKWEKHSAQFDELQRGLQPRPLTEEEHAAAEAENAAERAAEMKHRGEPDMEAFKKRAIELGMLPGKLEEEEDGEGGDHA